MGVLSRALERAGLVTVGVTLVREHTEKVNPPRALWVPYPYGRPLGAPDDPRLQHEIIRAALDLYAAPAGPVMAEFPEQGSQGDLTLPQASDAHRGEASALERSREHTHGVRTQRSGAG